MASPQRPLRDQCAILNGATIDYSVILPTATFIDTHLVIHRLAEADNQDLVAHVVSKLQESKILRKRRWARMRVGSVIEDARFVHLQSTADKIHDMCLDWDADEGTLGAATARMIFNPGETMESAFLETPGIKTTAQFVLVSSATGQRDDPPLEDISSVGRFRKSDKYRADAEIDIVAAAGHILNSDPTRRSMIAFTIVGKIMTFWYFSRSHIAVSEPFDYHENPEHFIRFLIFMMFASREELGYDPTVTHILDAQGNSQYRFQVDAKIYQTLRPLAKLRHLDIVSHAPRVWAVTELHAKAMTPIGETMVLKDFWPDSGARGELQIQTDIFDALRKLDKVGVPVDECPPGATGLLAEDAKKFFLTIALDAPVELNGEVDKAPVPESGFRMMAYAASYWCEAMEAPQRLSTLLAKTHKRVIFEEECQCIHRLSSYADFALGMAQLIQGLEYMRLAGYIHHDISPGNCLVHVSPNGERQLKIADLEFARPYHVFFPEPDLTGTPGFMAVEYQKSTHYFIPPEPREISAPGTTLRASLMMHTKKTTFFRYNFAHDLEAALWVYVWFLFNTVPDCVDAAETAEIRRDVGYYANKLVTDGSSERRGFVLDSEHDAARRAVDAIAALYERVPEGSVLLAGLNCFDVLVRMYKNVEATEPLDLDVLGMTRWDPKFFQRRYYKCLYDSFMAMHRRLGGVGYSAIRAHKFGVAAVQHPRKRACEDGEEEGARKKQCVLVDSSRASLDLFRLPGTPRSVEV